MQEYKHRTGEHKKGPDFWVPIIVVICILILGLMGG